MAKKSKEPNKELQKMLGDQQEAVALVYEANARLARVNRELFNNGVSIKKVVQLATIVGSDTYW